MNKLKIILILISFLVSVDMGFAQARERSDRQLEKAEKKRIRQEEKEKQKEEVFSLVKNQHFLMEITSLRGKYSYQQQVSPNVNFIKVEGDQLTLQTAGGFHPGYNGLGGITLHGRITSLEVLNPDDDNNIALLIHYTSTVLGSSTLSVNINADGYANARVSDNWGGRATFYGRLVDPDENRVFEGQSII